MLRKWLNISIALLLTSASLLANSIPDLLQDGHDRGCGHSQILETEQRLVTKSLYLRAVSKAKESMQLYNTKTPASKAAAAARVPAAPRVHLSFQLAGFSSKPQLSSSIQGYLMPSAVKVLQKLFQVVLPTGPSNLLLPSGWGNSKCIDADVDQALIAGKGPGKPVDYVLYVTSVACLPGTMAYAGVCAVGGDDNRPIMGAINLCPGGFELLSAKRQMETVIHELLHAFVFSPSLFPLFRGGDPRRNVSGPYGPTLSITSPAVVAALQRHSSCPTAAGVPLEDEGDGGSRGSHWEARLFQGELMLPAAPFAGRSDKYPRLDLTAALLQDSGWYLPRLQVVAPLDYGSGAGCSWLNSKARTWAQANPRQRLYCTQKQEAAAVNGTTCSYDNLAVSECFKVAKEDGTNFLNGVPFPYALQGISNCLSPSRSTSEAGESWWSATPGSWRGPTALCYTLAQQIVDTSGKRYAAGASCWDTACGDGGELFVSMRFAGGASNLVRCPTGKTLDLAKALPKRFKGGVLECPDNAKVCDAAADSCGPCLHGYCQAGRCHCALEYLGPACDVHVSQVDDMDAWFVAHYGATGTGLAADGVYSKLTAMADFASPSSGSSKAAAGGPSASQGGPMWVLPVSAGLELPQRSTPAASSASSKSSSSSSSTASKSSGSISSQPLAAAATAPLVSSSVSVYSAGSSSSSSDGSSGHTTQLLDSTSQQAAGSITTTTAQLIAKLQRQPEQTTTSTSGIAPTPPADTPLDSLLTSLMQSTPTAAAASAAAVLLPAVAPEIDHQQLLLLQLLQGSPSTVQVTAKKPVAAPAAAASNKAPAGSSSKWV